MASKQSFTLKGYVCLPNQKKSNSIFYSGVSNANQSYIFNKEIIPNLYSDFGERNDESEGLSITKNSNKILSNKSYIVPLHTVESLLVESIKLEKQNNLNVVKESSLENTSETTVSSGESYLKVLGTVIQRVHELYLTNRQKYIMQTSKGYLTINKPLSNYYLQQHLLGKKTIGVFAGKELSKFICFDVDMKENSDIATKKLLNYLVNDLKYDRKSILISISGTKGYHVELFFKTPKRVADLYNLYEKTLLAIDYQKHEIEFRPNYNQAVKLPLSYNLKNETFCDFVDDNLEILDTKKQELFNVVPANIIKLPQIINSNSINSITHLKDICKSKSLNIDSLSDSCKNTIAVSSIEPISIDFDKYAKDILANGHLLFSSSRHKATMSTLNYLIQNDIDKENAIIIVENVIKNTFENHRHLIDKNTDLNFALSEVKRLAQYTVKESKSNSQDWLPELTKDEIRFVLSTKKFSHKAVLLSLFLHWTRLGQLDSFYMTYEQINTYLGSLSKQRKLIYKDLLSLQEQNLISIVHSNQKQIGTYLKKPNVYKINFDSKVSTKLRDSIKKLHIKNIDDLIKELPKLFKEDELKEFISKKQFYEKFKPSYKTS